MTDEFEIVRNHFIAALEKEGLEARLHYAAEQCSASPERLAKLEEMIRAHHQTEGFLASEAEETPTALDITEKAGSRIGPYKLLQSIGEGGMGVVYMAEQVEPVERRVALKIIKPGMDSRQVIARFEAERQTLALMDHPNIAKIFDAGTTESERPFFVMELVKGIPITEYCDQHRLDPRQRLDLFRDVCHAVQHAHMKGVIHRDLKPSNILVADFDHRPVPKVIDFGVAKATLQQQSSSTLFTQFGHVLGTLDYMSPEQAKLNQLDIDSRSDVYSLGVLLYELLTGELPFDRKRLHSAAIDEVLRIIREEEPSKPSIKLLSSQSLAATAANRSTEPLRLGGLIRGDLDWVVMKALEKERSRRYDTASALARDLEHFLADEPVSACPPSIGYRFRKFSRRNRAAIVTGSLVLVCVVVGVIGTAWQALRATRALQTAEMARESESTQRVQAEQQRDRAMRAEQLAAAQAAQAEQAAEREREQHSRADAARKLAEAAELKARQNLYASHMNLAQKAWEDTDILRMQDLLARHVPGPEEPDWRTFEWYYLLGLCNREDLTLISNRASCKPAFSPDGKLLAVSRGGQGVSLWDLNTYEEVRMLEDQRVGGPLAFSQDGNLLASISQNRIQLWDPHTAMRLHHFGNHRGTVSNLIFTPDGKRLISSDGGTLDSKDMPGSIQVFEVESGKQIYKLDGHAKYIYSIALSPDGNRLISSGEEVFFWDLASGRQTKNPGISAGRTVAWSPQGDRIAAPDPDSPLIAIWDVASGKLIKRLEASGNSGWLCFSPDGNEIASVHIFDSTLKVWDLSSGQLTNLFKGHSQWMFYVSFSADGRKLVTYGRDGLAKVWPHKVEELSQHFPGRIDRSRDFELPGRELFAVSADGRFSAGLAGPSRVRLVQLASHASQAVANVPGTVHALAFHPNQDRLAVAHATGLTVVHADTGDTLLEREAGTGIYTIGFSPDGSRLAVGKQTGEIEIWRSDTLESENQLPKMVRETHVLRKVAFAPDGESLAAITYRVGGEGDFFLWDSASWRLRASYPSKNAWLTDLAFSPDSRTLVVAEGDRFRPHDGAAVRLFDTANGRQLARLSTLNSYCMAVTFAPDGRTLVTASDTGELTFWDFSTHEERMTIDPPGPEKSAFGAYYSLVAALSFAADGKTVFANDVRGKVTAWATPNQQALTRIERTGQLRRAQELANAGRFEQAGEVMADMIDQHDEPQYHLELGNYFAEQALWKEAIAEFQRVVGSGTTDYRPSYLLALAQLGDGDVAAFQETRRTMLERYAATHDSATAEFVSWTCVLKPCPDLDGDSLLQLASLTNGTETLENGPTLRNLGAALYRLGYYADASTVLAAAQEVLEQDMHRTTPAYGLYFQSMAHVAVNKVDEAKRCLQKADQQSAAELTNAVGRAPWNRRITLHILREEAELAIKEMDPSVVGPTLPLASTSASLGAHALAMRRFEMSQANAPNNSTWKSGKVFIDRISSAFQQTEIEKNSEAVRELVAQVRDRYATHPSPSVEEAHALRNFGTILQLSRYQEECIELFNLAARAFGLAAKQGAADERRASQAHCLWLVAREIGPPHRESYLKDAEEIMLSILKDGQATNATGSAWRIFGQVRWEQGRAAEAKRLLEHATDLNPSDPWAHSNLLNVYLKLAKTPVADTLFRAKRAIDDQWQHPPIASICWQLGDKLAHEEEWAAAAVLFRWLLEKQPDDASLIVSVALCDWMTEGDDHFVSHCRAAMQQLADRELAPVSKPFLIALCTLKAGAIEDPSALVSSARQMKLDEPTLPFWQEQVLGTTLLRDEQYQEAIAELEKVESNPLFSPSYPLALAYQAMGDMEAAREQLAAGDAWVEQHVVTGTPSDWKWLVTAQIWRKEAHQQLEKTP